MEQNRFIIKIIYSKGEGIRYISHLDHMRLLERAMRRSYLPVDYSKGFNPRMRISYKTRALKVGEVSNSCEAEITFLMELPLEEIKVKLNRVLPEGFEILSVSLGNHS